MKISTGHHREMFISVVSKGAIITRLRDKDLDIIYPYSEIGEKIRGGIPICFPFFGPPKEGFEGISQHGWLREEDLEPDIRSKDKISFLGENIRYFNYPWHLFYAVNISLFPIEKFIRISLDVKRLIDGVDGDAPINPAFHPYFSNLGKRSVIIDYKEITDFNSKAKIIPVKKRYFIIDLGQRKLEMTLEGDVGRDPHVALWSDNNNYFCVEPMLTSPENFNTSKGKYLKKGESFSLQCSLKII